MMNIFKKIVCYVSVLLLSSSLSLADITLNIQDSNGLFYPDASTPLPAGALIQLIWSADAVYAGFGSGSGPLDTEVSGGNYSAYNDYLLWSGYGDIPGGISGGDIDGINVYSNSAVGGATINNGYVYAYIFQNAAPVAGDFFARSTMAGPPLSEATNIPPEVVSIDFAPTAAVTLDTYTIQAIPEPSTMVLMLLGFVALGGMRKRSRK